MIKSLCILSLLPFIVSSVSASGSQLLKWKGTREFYQATVENVIIDEHGSVFLSPGIDTLFQSTEIFLWDAVYDSKGNLYVSSGNDGKIFRITPTGQVFTVFTSEGGAEIFTLAVDKHDNVYCGESPSGIIYKIAKNGDAKTYYKTSEQYVWKLLFDESGVLFAATGDRGKVFRITGKDRGEEYYASAENHIVDLCMHNKKLYAGTEPNGLFIEIEGKERAVVHYDSKENEVHCISALDDEIFFTTICRPLTAVTSSYTTFFASGIGTSDHSTESSVLYKFNIDTKTVIQLWQCPTPPIYSLSAFGKRKVLIGTENGKLYASDADGRISQLHHFENAPVLALKAGRKKNAYVLLTGNLGNAIQMGPDLSKYGEIESRVIDTGRKSVFGKVDWDIEVPSGTSCTVWLRVGNRENPDEDWTRWKKMKKGSAINLAPARFIQIKCELETASGGKSPQLKEVSISYLPENRAPVFHLLLVCPVGVNASEDYDPLQGMKMPLSERDRDYFITLGYDLPMIVYKLEKGKRCAVWVASDPDGDSLSSVFYYKGEHEKEWKEMKKDLMVPVFLWDETALPDGIYSAKVLVRDDRDNPESRAQDAELISEEFIIDNTAPVVEVHSIKTEGKNIEIIVSAKDELSILKSARYSVNGGEWKFVLPDDGIFDDKQEKFVATIKNKSGGEYTIIFKATDLSLNTGVGKATVELK